MQQACDACAARRLQTLDGAPGVAERELEEAQYPSVRDHPEFLSTLGGNGDAPLGRDPRFVDIAEMRIDEGDGAKALRGALHAELLVELRTLRSAKLGGGQVSESAIQLREKLAGARRCKRNPLLECVGACTFEEWFALLEATEAEQRQPEHEVWALEMR